MEKIAPKYVKRTQKDDSMSFKLSVVYEFESCDISLKALKRKYGIQGDSTITRWLENMIVLTLQTNVIDLWEKSKIKNYWN